MILSLARAFATTLFLDPRLILTRKLVRDILLKLRACLGTPEVGPEISARFWSITSRITQSFPV